MRKKNKKMFSMPEIVLTPLIDVALTLVVILMVVAPVIRNGVQIELPQGKSMEVSAQQEIIISINKQGDFFLNSYPVKRESLVQEVVQVRGVDQEMPVYIHGDQKIEYGVIMSLLDELKMADVKTIGMSTRACVQA